MGRLIEVATDTVPDRSSTPIQLTILRQGDLNIVDLAELGSLIPRSETHVDDDFLREIADETAHLAAAARGTITRVAIPSPVYDWLTLPSGLNATLPKSKPLKPLKISEASPSKGHQPTVPTRYGAWAASKVSTYDVELVVGRLFEIMPELKMATLLLSHGAGSSG